MIEFDEAWYLQQNLDVAQSVLEGGWKSGFEHYQLHGKAEGRPGAPEQESIAANLEAHKGLGYLVPTDLSVSSVQLKRVALHGSCLLQDWGFQHANSSNAAVDIFLTNHLGGVPERSDEEIMKYDLQLVQIAFRNIFSDGQIWRIRHDDDAALNVAFEDSCARLEVFLADKMEWNTQCGLLTLVVNFMVPQQNPMGRLFPRYHLSNVQYFFERLNERLEAMVRRYKNAYILDIDNLSASLGRRYIQDDSIDIFAHEAMIPNIAPSSTRIEPLLALSEYYDLGPRYDIHDAIWAELEAIHRTVSRADTVKLVVVDLDDTLWHGVSGEWSDVDSGTAEGWPIGFAEALIYLKMRGILLAIISKNDDYKVRGIWTKIFHDRLLLDDFAAIKINWISKPENMAEILEGVNVLPRNVVFIDDNPAERAAMKSAFPQMRILGRHPYYLRRILLWSSETQVASITEESGNRTEMVKAQLERESVRKTISREDFLRNAAPSVTMLPITVAGHPRFPRCFELINKTNQFNTTGRRWKVEEFESLFRDGGRLYTFEVTDSFTSYGLVGVVIVRAAQIEQWVMSCRVFGYNIEGAVMSYIIGDMRAQGAGEITAALIETDANLPSRDLFSKCGFHEEVKGIWQLAENAAPTPPPAHVAIGWS